MSQVFDYTSVFHPTAEPVKLLLSSKIRETRQSASKDTTRSNTPDSKRSHGTSESTQEGFNSSEDDSSSNYTADSESHLEIDVKPKKKVFENPEDRRKFVEQYKMKAKTELCKNFELRGWCKFGDTCSFAHGRKELQEKIHLHKQYKTKPCQQFFKAGWCPYGIRCQYLHKEAMVPNVFYVPTTETSLSAERSNYSFELLNEIWRMSSSEIRVERILNKIPERRRLSVFKDLTSSRL